MILLLTVSGVARMNMQKPPVNSLSLEMLTDMSISLDKLHAEGNLCYPLVCGRVRSGC